MEFDVDSVETNQRAKDPDQQLSRVYTDTHTCIDCSIWTTRMNGKIHISAVGPRVLPDVDPTNTQADWRNMPKGGRGPC